MRQQLTPYKKYLAIRDGKECFYCGIVMNKDKLTIEHFLEVNHGGSNDMHNLCLSCYFCNQQVVGKSIVQKFKYREEMRSDV